MKTIRSERAKERPASGLRAEPIGVMAVHTHPVQYLAPLFRRYARRDDLVFHVVYSRWADGAPPLDPDFGFEVAWDVPLLDGYEYSVLPAGWKTWRRPQERLRQSLLVRVARDVDLVVSYGYRSRAALLSLAVAKVTRKKWAFVTDNHKLANADGRVRFGKKALLGALCSVADGVLACSVRSAEFYREFAGAKVHLLPHAVDDEMFGVDLSADERRAIRARHDTSESAPVFLFVGKLAPGKRTIDLIRAAELVPEAIVWIVGSGTEESTLRSAAEPLGDRVKFLGFLNQSRLPEVYASVDALVLPSEFETYGLVVSEAAAAGRPSIVSDACGVVGSVVVGGETGLVYRTGDVAALAEAMRTMMGGGAESLGARVKNLQTDWSAETNVETFAELARVIVQHGARRSARRN